MKRIHHSAFVAPLNSPASVRNRPHRRLDARRGCGDLVAGIRRHSTRAISVVLMVSLLSTSTPAASETVLDVGREWQAGLAFWLRANDLPAKLYRKLTNQEMQAQAQESQENRDAKISSIKIYPGDLTLHVEEKVTLAAVAYDADGIPVGGVNFRWSALDEQRKRSGPITQQGDFEALLPGTFIVTAAGGGQKEQVTITVEDVKQRVKKKGKAEGDGRPISTRDLPSATTSASETPAPGRYAHAWKSGSSAGRAAKIGPRPVTTKSAPLNSAPPPVMPVEPYDGGWDPGNYPSADDPHNGRGDPPGTPLDGGAGSSNFQVAAPVLGLPGRGLSVSLALTGNSRMWNKSGNQLNYDIDRDWPAPGFSLGFGKLLGIAGASMIVDADGTRHGFAGTIFPGGTYFEGHTTDGSFIDYWHQTNSVGWILYGQARLSNGTIIDYGANGPGGVFPTRITDSNGNYITITYLHNAGPQIQTVTDTLGRVLTFYYNENNLLTAITAPGLAGGIRTLVRLHYTQINLAQYSNYGFSGGVTTVVRDANPWVFDAIYYPGTGNGYWFGDSASNGHQFGSADSYSSYGMLAKMVEVRGMTFSGPDPIPASQGPTGQGAITSAGQMSRQQVYNYPQYPGDPNGTPSSNLGDAPTYTSMTETWTRDGNPGNNDSATTGYLIEEVATNPSQPTIPSRKVELTLPNGTRSIQYSYNYTNRPESDPLKALDGLIYQDETRNSSGALLQSSVSTWEQGAYQTPRPTRVDAINERNQITATGFVYGSVYNQVAEVRNFAPDGTTILRSTHTQYENSSSYTSRHIFNLPISVEVFADNNSNRVSKTDYQYDGQTLTARPSVTQHDQAYNPYADAEGFCYYTPDWSDPDCYGGICNELSPSSPNSGGCDGYCPDIYVCPYNSWTDYRGNITQVTSYANVTTGSATGAISETRRYDITGNMVTAGTTCCEQTSVSFTLATQYAYPLSQTRGSASDPYAQVTTSSTYDFNTGLALSATDANGRLSQTDYDPGSLRPLILTMPSGAHTHYAYNDAGLQVTRTTYPQTHAANETAIADQNIKLLNGHGQVRQERALSVAGVWDFVDTTYDNLGRIAQQTRPYRAGEAVQNTSTLYDALSRVNRVISPDGSVTETYYNEVDFDATDAYTPHRPDAVSGTAPGETTLVRDPWGRERWGRSDSTGRLVEVVEPNPNVGNSVATGGWVTAYAYDAVGNLTGVTQGPVGEQQTRSFKYDSMGRLTAQKLAETSATLDQAGTYQAGGGTWSDVFTYDGHSNVASRTDARGVRTVYSYLVGGNHDPLNRLQSVSFDTSGDPNHGLQPGNPNYYLRVLDAATVTYQYRQKTSGGDLKDVAQLATITASGIVESFGYDSQGHVITKGLVVNGRPSLDTDYAYDNLDRVSNITYPKREPGMVGSPRKVVHHDYDVASRVGTLTVDGQNFASNFAYNASGQANSLQVGASGTNQITETYNYEPETGLLSGQTVVRGSGGSAATLLDLSYQYTNASGKRTGQLTKLLNNQNHNKDRGYTYDALGRLKLATGGPAGSLWSQTYAYDRFGNRLSVSASGFSAKAGSVPRAPDGSPKGWEGSAGSAVAAATNPTAPANGAPTEPRVMLSTEQLAARTEVAVPESLRTDAPRSISDSSFHHGARTAPAPSLLPLTPQGGPPVFTDDPLVAGVMPIKAVHVTELRTAVNQARALGGLGAASWTDPTLAGTIVKAVHITELRTGLAGARAALGLSVASYTDPTLTATSTVVKAVHITELRQRVTETLAGPAGCPAGQNLSIDLFVKNFYQAALNRQPNATELQTWSDLLRQAYYQGQGQLLASAKYLGRQLFQSQEYINRGRSDHDYVYDLYKGYLQRDPDQSGWDGWTTQAGQPNGRENVRNAFELSGEFANKVASLCAVSASGSAPIPLDGLANLSYETASNRISIAGFSYDAAGNQTRILRADGSAQKFQYDAANRLISVRDDYGYTIATYTYGATNERLMTDENGFRTYYVSQSGTVVAEYTESGGSTTPVWSKSYVYLGARLLATVQPNGAGETIRYHHPDRLGTRLVTSPSDGSSFEQVTLPFGTPLNAESSGATNRRFTSYDRSVATGMDYAVNRHYDSQQGRFTQVDPIGMKAVSLEHPQTLNLYSYVANDPINRMDPSGLFWGKLFKFFKKLLRILVLVAVVVVLSWVSVGAFAVAFGASLTGGSALLASIIGWAAFIAAAVVATVLISEFFGHLSQWIHRCRVPNFAGLSRARQDELLQRGVSPEQWDSLKNKQRLGYFNITAAIASVGLSLAGWVVDWAAGGIQQDRVFFVAGPGATNLVGQVVATRRFTHGSNPEREHPGYPESYRQNVLHRSLQMSFSGNGNRLEADLDSFGLYAVSPLGWFGHKGESLLHGLSRILGGSGKTNPYNVAFRESWECK